MLVSTCRNKGSVAALNARARVGCYLLDFYNFHVSSREMYAAVACGQFKTYSGRGGPIWPFVHFHDRDNSTAFEQILYELYQVLHSI